MEYITINDLNNTIRKNLWKIPRDIDFVITIPRSGSIAGSIISSYLNLPMIDIEGYMHDIKPYGGGRIGYYNANHKTYNRALVVDDTVCNGKAMNEAKKKLSSKTGVELVYMCVYLEGRASNTVNFYLEDIRNKTENYKKVVLYEWNLFQHYEFVMLKCLYDIDGVFCLDPPDERRTEDYLQYIQNATPLFIPRTKIGGIITYRLIKNQEITKNWLKSNGISYNRLIMFDAQTWDERNNKGISPGRYKGEYYKTHNEFELFVESDDNQAREIASISHKPVYCVETNKMYQ